MLLALTALSCVRVVSRVAFIASVNGSCYGTFAWTICLLVCRSVCPQSVLWQNALLDPDAVWDGNWGRLRDGVLDGGCNRRREGAVFEGG